jgi:phospholipase/lecithinase/hemolysin
MRSDLRRLLGVILVALTALVPAAWGAGPNRFVVFGDSLSDPGNAFVLLGTSATPPFESLIPDAPYARGGMHFSNGPTWIEQLAVLDHAQASAGPAFRLPGVFFNYAVGGARARLPGDTDVGAQVGRFLQDVGGQAPAGALYVLWAGGDDLRDALTALSTDPTGATSAVIVQQAVSSIASDIVSLYNAGARSFLVPNAPDVGLAPAVRLAGPAAQGAASFLSSQFNAGLEQALVGLESGLGIQIARVDVFGLLHEIVAAPSALGLTDAETPCIALNTTVHPFCARADQFLFWDGIHPTAAGHRILAQRANAALAAQAALALAHR